jgi:hypothetical protein
MPDRAIGQHQFTLDKSKPSPKKWLNPGSRFWFILIGVSFILMVVTGAVLIWDKYDEYQTLTKNSVSDNQARDAQVLSAVGKLMLLPADEAPTIVPITDVESLKKEQPFYANAQNGDLVLVFMKSQKAIIYNSVKNILVNVGPIYVPSSTSNQAATNPVNKNN